MFQKSVVVFMLATTGRTTASPAAVANPCSVCLSVCQQHARLCEQQSRAHTNPLLLAFNDITAAATSPLAAISVAPAAATGVKLLPESYAVLIYAALESSPPDVAVAKTLYQALSGTDTDPQQPWAVLCRLLAAKGFASDAVAAVREGLRAGRVLDGDVAEAYVKALCDTQELVSLVWQQRGGGSTWFTAARVATEFGNQ